MGKGEIAHYERFLLFPQCFQKTCTVDTLKPGLVWERLNQIIATSRLLLSNYWPMRKLILTTWLFIWPITTVIFLVTYFWLVDTLATETFKSVIQTWCIGWCWNKKVDWLIVWCLTLFSTINKKVRKIKTRIIQREKQGTTMMNAVYIRDNFSSDINAKFIIKQWNLTL